MMKRLPQIESAFWFTQICEIYIIEVERIDILKVITKLEMKPTSKRAALQQSMPTQTLVMQITGLLCTMEVSKIGISKCA